MSKYSTPPWHQIVPHGSVETKAVEVSGVLVTPGSIPQDRLSVHEIVAQKGDIVNIRTGTIHLGGSTGAYMHMSDTPYVHRVLVSTEGVTVLSERADGPVTWAVGMAPVGGQHPLRCLPDGTLQADVGILVGDERAKTFIRKGYIDMIAGSDTDYDTAQSAIRLKVGWGIGSKEGGYQSIFWDVNGWMKFGDFTLGTWWQADHHGMTYYHMFSKRGGYASPVLRFTTSAGEELSPETLHGEMRYASDVTGWGERGLEWEATGDETANTARAGYLDWHVRGWQAGVIVEAGQWTLEALNDIESGVVTRVYSKATLNADVAEFNLPGGLTIDGDVYVKPGRTLQADIVMRTYTDDRPPQNAEALVGHVLWWMTPGGTRALLLGEGPDVGWRDIVTGSLLGS